MANNNLHLEVSDLHLDPLKSTTDEHIMQQCHLDRYTPAQQLDLNLVRMWLQVATLADMCDNERPNRIQLLYLDAQRPPGFTPSQLWPRQQQPTKSQQRLWKRFIRSSYLRYTPYWKVVPVGTPILTPAPPPPPTSFADIFSYIANLRSKTERRLLDGLVQQATDDQLFRAFRTKARLYIASDRGLSHTSATHGWVLSTRTRVLFTCSGPVDGPFDTNSSTRSELGGCASSLLLLSSLSKVWGIRHKCSFKWYTDSQSAISRFHKYCRRQRSIRMPPDADLLSIISASLRDLRCSFRPKWIKAHQDNVSSYESLPFAARLNVDADFLATCYREHGRLRCRSHVDHRRDNQSTLFINGAPITGQYDECLRYHINGYHQRPQIQKTEQWTGKAWDSVDFFTFGRHFRKLRPAHRTQHFKCIHNLLPLGIQRFREATIKDPKLQQCPCCQGTAETYHHFPRCAANPSYASSLATFRSEILTSDVHPVRYLLPDGICHALSSDLPYAPLTQQYPPRPLPAINAALTTQRIIGWQSALKGYLAKEWSELSQLDMHNNSRDTRTGEARMTQILHALSTHIQRLWLARNDCLHDNSHSNVTVSAESVEIKYYHSRPHLLRLGDQHYCNRSLSKLSSGSPATRRRWLKKVKQSSAELTKDGTCQSRLTSFFRYI